MSDKHPDAKLTLRQAFDKHYIKDDLSKAAITTFKAMLKRWERHSGNPPVGDATDATMDRFKNELVAEELSPVTVNGYLKHIRCVFRRLAPPFTGNPGGLNIIERVPYFRPLKEPRKIPRRVSQEDLSRVYIAARVMRTPKLQPCPPADYWRAVLVTAYFTGLRKSDLFSLQKNQIDRDESVIRFSAAKTGKEMELPIHPAALEHIDRIMTPDGNVFPHMGHNSGRWTKLWRKLLSHAGVDYFTLHDLRRTAASEIDRARSGMGAVLLQHRPMDITGISYLNQLEELRESLQAMRVPVAFKHGPAQADRAELKAKEEREKLMRTEEFRVPSTPDPADFHFPGPRFREAGFATYSFRGEWFQLTRRQCWMLQALVEAEGPLTVEQLKEPAYRGIPKAKIPNRKCWEHNVASLIARLRKVLREHLNIDESWDPLPCLQKGNGGVWALFFPPTAGRRAAS